MPPSAGIATGAGRENRPPSGVRPEGHLQRSAGRGRDGDRGVFGLRRRQIGLAVGLLLLAGVVARFVAPSALWLDEAQSVAISRLPLGQLFQALREDGSPPLYYLLLHGWMAAFGSGAFAVRALSGLFSVVALGLGWRITRQLAGRRTALVATLLLATSPFAIRYASETRMYSLLMLEVVLGAMALRAVARHRGPWPVLAVGAVTGALLNTHLWAFNLVAAVGILALVALRSRRRDALRVLAGLALGGLLFLPWLSSFLVQLAHTGTPWDRQKGLTALPVAFSAWGGGGVPGWLLGTCLVLLVAVGVLAVPSLRGPQAHLELALQLRPSRIVLLVTGVGTLVLAGLVSLASSSGVAGRYTSVALPSVLALAALGVTALPTARSRAVTVGVVCCLGLGIAYGGIATPRTQAGQIARALSAAQPQDLVVFCPDQLGPAVSRLAPDDLRLVAYPDLRPADRIDWTDYAQRNTSVPPAEVADAVLDRAHGAAIWVVTSTGYRIPPDATCRQFVEDLADVRGPQTLVVGRHARTFESERLQRFAPAA